LLTSCLIVCVASAIASNNILSIKNARPLALSICLLSLPPVSAIYSPDLILSPRKNGKENENHDSSPFAQNHNDGNESEKEFEDEDEERYRNIHGIIMSVVVLIMFPLGALAMRVLGRWWLHAMLQALGMLLLLAGFGIGVFVAKEERKVSSLVLFCFTEAWKLILRREQLFNNVHTILGTVLVGLFVTAQPLLGVLQHLFYRKNQRRGAQGHAHLWLGRLLIVGGVVNGGLGLALVGDDDDDDDDGWGKWGSVYIGVSVGMAALYLLVLVITAFLKRRASKKVAV